MFQESTAIHNGIRIRYSTGEIFAVRTQNLRIIEAKRFDPNNDDALAVREGNWTANEADTKYAKQHANALGHQSVKVTINGVYSEEQAKLIKEAFLHFYGYGMTVIIRNREKFSVRINIGKTPNLTRLVREIISQALEA